MDLNYLFIKTYNIDTRRGDRPCLPSWQTGTGSCAVLNSQLAGPAGPSDSWRAHAARRGENGWFATQGL